MEDAQSVEGCLCHKVRTGSQRHGLRAIEHPCLAQACEGTGRCQDDTIAAQLHPCPRLAEDTHGRARLRHHKRMGAVGGMKDQGSRRPHAIKRHAIHFVGRIPLVASRIPRSDHVVVPHSVDHLMECGTTTWSDRSEEHTSELQSPDHLVCRLLLEKKNKPSLTYLSKVSC